MKKKNNEFVHRPLILAGIFLVMIIALTGLIHYASSLSEYANTHTDYKAPHKGNSRAETQIAKLTILPQDGSAPSNNSPSDQEVVVPAAEGVNPAGEHVKFQIDRFQKLATQPLKFQIFDDAGRELTPDYLSSLHGVKVYFFLVHADLSQFHHIVPEYRNGVWNARAYMPFVGTYYAYTMIDPLRSDPVTYSSDLVVRVESPEELYYPDPTLSARDEGSSSYTSTMKMKRFDDYRGFLFEVQKDGGATVIVPQYDAIGMMTLFRHGDPTAVKLVQADIASQEHLGKVSFSMEHLVPGRYTAFLEVKVGEKAREFSHTFDIGK